MSCSATSSDGGSTLSVTAAVVPLGPCRDTAGVSEPDPGDAAAQLRLTVRPHWVNAIVVKPLAQPYLRVGGVEHAAAWGQQLVVAVPAGEHEIEAFMRYRGTHLSLGVGRLRVQVAPGERVDVEARNGWANHMPFVVRQLPSDR